jgi:hypothetical protein
VLELFFRKAGEAQAALLARRIDGERTRLRLGAGELGMRPDESELLLA